MLTIPGKIPVRVHPFFWVLIFLLGWINSEAVQPMIIWAVVIFVSVLVHEYGHALTGMAFGQTVQIDLLAFGGLTSRQGPPLKLWQEFLIVLNGPLAGFSLYFLADWWLQQVGRQSHPYLTYALVVATLVNFWWTILNLLPIQPMDGGKLLSILLESVFGLRGIKIALFISMLLAGAFAAFFFFMSNLFMGAILLMFMYESYRSWKEALSVTEHDRDDSVQHLFADAQREEELGHYDEAEEKYNQVRSQANKGVLFNGASQHLASLYARKGRFKEALDLLTPIKSKLSMEGLNLLQQISYQAGDLKNAVEYGTEVFNARTDPQVALTNALSYAQLGDVQRTLAWLQASLREGLPNLREILAMHEFDKVRHDPNFEAFARQVQ